MLVTRSHILFSLLVITGASAQSANFSTCGQECLVTYVTDGTCRSLSNVTCLCTDTTVQTALGTCLLNCSSADVATAKALENSLCSNTTSSTNGTSSRTTSKATSTSASNTSPSSASTSTTSAKNAASPVEQLPFISFVIAIAGAVIGGAFAL